jgi:glycosyltransferase involved in cell wall biosynthesis
LQAQGSRVKIWIAGEGSLRPHVVEIIETRHLTNLVYLGKLTPDELAQLYGVCDVGLCLYAPESNVAMPDKVYDYMAAGLPVVNSLQGELEVFLGTNRVGVQYRAGDPVSLASALSLLADDSGRRREMAGNSYNAAFKFDRRVQYGRFADLVEQVGNDSRILLTQYGQPR